MSWFLSQLHELTFLSMVLRFLTATLAGAVIGYSRGKAQHAAGLRTHILVCIGAAGAMIVGEYLVSVKGFDTDAQAAAFLKELVKKGEVKTPIEPFILAMP